MIIHQRFLVGGLVAITSLSAFILTSATVSADTETRTARIQVSSACTMDGSVTSAHTANVNAGSYTENIGSTVFSVVCNDSAGFGVYAIGYTDNEDGNAVMQGTGNNTIATGTATSGNTSNWAMKLSTVEGTVAPTILNNYDNYNIVPSADYVKVASYPNATSASSSAVFKTSYAAYVTLTQPADTYTGQVKYVLVHPANGEAPEKQNTIPYIDPDPDITKDTTHSDGTVFPGNSLLRAFEIAYTNAKKPMYIEDANATEIPGWRPMTAADSSTVGGKQVRFAMQDIGMTLDGTANGIKVCDAAYSTGVSGPVDEALVMDIRDGKTYWIAKLADGKCWMTQNLDLDLNTNKILNHNDTDLGWTDNNPTATFRPNKNTTDFTGTTVNGWGDGRRYSYDGADTLTSSANPGDVYYYSSGSSADDSALSMADCVSASDTHSMGECQHYHAGNYYTWNMAVAMNDSSSIAGANGVKVYAPNSICPASWRLPYGLREVDGVAETSEMLNMLYEQGITTTKPTTNVTASWSQNGFTKARTTPAYIVRSGAVGINNQANGTLSTHGRTGHYWLNSSVQDNYANVGILTYYASTYDTWVFPQSSYYRTIGHSIRCIAR